MSQENQSEFHIETEHDIVLARKVAREAAEALSFGLVDVTRIVTAVSELVRNTTVHAGSGVMRLRTVAEGSRSGLELIFEDHGPGIPDLEQALEPGFSTAGSLGMGLSGVKRLMDEMDIQSENGKGTTVMIRKWRKN